MSVAGIGEHVRTITIKKLEDEVLHNNNSVEVKPPASNGIHADAVSSELPTQDGLSSLRDNVTDSVQDGVVAPIQNEVQARVQQANVGIGSLAQDTVMAPLQENVSTRLENADIDVPAFSNKDVVAPLQENVTSRFESAEVDVAAFAQDDVIAPMQEKVAARFESADVGDFAKEDVTEHVAARLESADVNVGHFAGDDVMAPVQRNVASRLEQADIDVPALAQENVVAPLQAIAPASLPTVVAAPLPNVTTGPSLKDGMDAAVVTQTNGAVAASKVDELAPANSLWTTQRDAAVKLRLKASGRGSETPVTIPSFFKSIVARNPNGVAMAVKREGQWQKWTYSQYFADVRTAAKAFIKLGLEPYKGVGIIGFNSPEWFLADLGCIFAGGLVSGIYTTNSPEACRYVAASCQANVLVVENHQQLQKILQVRDQLPHLKAIVQYSGEVAVKDDNIYTWSQFMEKGRDVSDEILDNRINAQAPNKCCMLIYTSGTTGNPKGVMLSHDNLTWTLGTMMKECATHLPLQFGQLSMVSYLPLSHIAAQMLDIYVVMGFGGTTYFAQPDALKGSLKNTLVEVRPHVFLGVPRVWEKMQESLVEMGRNLSGLKKRIGRWAKGVGLKANYALMNGGSTPFGMGIADFLLFKKVRNGLGLDRCVLRLSGAAPITKDTLEYFMSINQPICEVYGMSECSGPHTNAFPMVNRVTSVGKELTGVMTVLDKPDADGNGEVVMHGRHVFMGYLDEEEKTREALDDNGGLHSGDVGKKDKDGFLYITGRIKELIITAGGENIPPVAIEDAVKEALPAVSQCMLIGDKRRFLSLLLSLKVEVDPDSQEPTDKLTPAALDWVREAGSQASTVSAILDPGDRVVLQAIQRGIDKVNSRATSNAQKIQKWSLLPKDFSIPGGELGPTMKMRRPIIHKMYMKTIDAFYEDTPITPTTPAPPAAAAALSAS